MVRYCISDSREKSSPKAFAVSNRSLIRKGLQVCSETQAAPLDAKCPAKQLRVIQVHVSTDQHIVHGTGSLRDAQKAISYLLLPSADMWSYKTPSNDDLSLAQTIPYDCNTHVGIPNELREKQQPVKHELIKQTPQAAANYSVALRILWSACCHSCSPSSTLVAEPTSCTGR